MTVVVIILVGLAAGLLSGLIGIGGGVLMVPFLYFFYDRPDLFGVVVSPEARVVLAHGTSLFVMMPTAVRGTLVYHRARLVEWRAVWPIAGASVVAALIGARIAVQLPPEFLKTGFGTVLILSGIRLAWRRRAPAGSVSAAPAPPDIRRFPLHKTIFTGLLIGLLSALLGLGGGTIGIPLLIYILKLDVKQVSATSMGIIGLTASAGAIGYMISGLGDPGLPPFSLGYVHVTAGVVMFLGALVSVRWGAMLNQRMKPRALELLFGIFFIVVGVRLAGRNLWVLLTGAMGG